MRVSSLSMVCSLNQKQTQNNIKLMMWCVKSDNTTNVEMMVEKLLAQ